MEILDRRLLKTRRGTPVRSLPLVPGAETVDTGSVIWIEVGMEWFAIASALYGDEDGPGVIAFQWVRSPGVVELLLQNTWTSQVVEFPEPDADLLGFSPMTYGAALKFEKKSRRTRPMLSASYRIEDGAFTHSELSGSRADHQFADANPLASDKAIGVTLRLSD